MTSHVRVRLPFSLPLMTVSAESLNTDRSSRTLSRTGAAALRAMRPAHWAKNGLVLVPTLTAHAWRDPRVFVHAFLVTVAFSLIASAIYLVNDVLDAPHDRQHAVKRDRPIASGALAPSLAIGLAFVLVLMAGLAIRDVASPVRIVLLAYGVLMLAYSLLLKRVLALDVVALAIGYTLRLAAGAAGIDVKLSPWLAAFSLFVFASLALLKRAAELRALVQREYPAALPAPGRAYASADLPIVSMLGASSAMVAVMVLALYVTSPEVRVLYRAPEVLWLLCPTVLFWLVRLWVLALRGVVREDPVLFALRDLPSLAVLAACVGVVLLAL